jgi:hypothetical protein
MKLIIKW